MRLTARQKEATEKLSAELKRDPGTVHIGWGLKRVNGKYTGERCLIVGVLQKGDAHAVVMAPRSIDDIKTDVVEYGHIEALALRARRVDLEPLAKTQRRRPLEGGWSCGHPRITAGTHAMWVGRVGESGWFSLSNNHVLADSNGATVGDRAIQPGAHDGGVSPADDYARLSSFATIRFGNGGSPPKKDKAAARWFWKASLAIPNAFAQLTGCPYRAVTTVRHFSAQRVEQPFPNLVDAAVAKALEERGVLPDDPMVIDEIGSVLGITDLLPGDTVTKVGRTTGKKTGVVESIGTASVSYGEAGVAEFEDQLVIRGTNGEFSAGGDSGSGIVGAGMKLGGLLFAGSETVTIANRISNVQALLGVTL